MPENDIDYSNTIIYKITCKDKTIKDLYVGHTTNFVQRKKCHKISCISKTAINNNYKLYRIIRENGGWENWNMEIVNFFNCKNLMEARQKEQEYFISLNATLNSVQPFTEANVPLNELEDKIIGSNYVCKICDYSTTRKSSIDKHNLSKRHLDRVKLIAIEEAKLIGIQMFVCKNCDKIYNARNSLWYHNKKCTTIKVEKPQVLLNLSEETFINLMSMVMELKESNIELQHKLSNNIN